ncbi:HAD family hydrolase (plasmid) [Latilactobacillus sp. 5-91]|uniref:HAD family hydrolase n=1 Tax=Latilactobacillus sp. 5-91 TaxID=3410924 RepID=UPI003C737C85
MDGVIVDTEYYDFQIQVEFITMHNPNHTFSDKDLVNLVGKSYEDLYSLLQKFLDYKLSVEEIERAFNYFSEQRYRKIDYQKLFRKDILFTLDYAKEHELALAVASSSKHQHILDVLEACNIKDYFDIINSGESLVQSKPNPEIYLRTLNELNISANECLAIEDSYYGIAASRSAGIKTIAYKEKRMNIDQSNADICAVDMLEVFNIIKQYSKKEL